MCPYREELSIPELFFFQQGKLTEQNILIPLSFMAAHTYIHLNFTVSVDNVNDLLFYCFSF